VLIIIIKYNRLLQYNLKMIVVIIKFHSWRRAAEIARFGLHIHINYSYSYILQITVNTAWNKQLSHR